LTNRVWVLERQNLSQLEQLVTIELFGQPYTFKAKSEAVKAKEVAEILTQEVGRVQYQQSGLSSNMTNLTILILAALNIAHENMELKRSHSTILQNISERSASLIRKLDDFVQKNCNSLVTS
jgi:cell division protein ZapA (FtsZ GTPase activity inhibitor)